VCPYDDPIKIAAEALSRSRPLVTPSDNVYYEIARTRVSTLQARLACRGVYFNTCTLGQAARLIRQAPVAASRARPRFVMLAHR